jgi:hypothetical protein
MNEGGRYRSWIMEYINTEGLYTDNFLLYIDGLYLEIREEELRRGGEEAEGDWYIVYIISTYIAKRGIFEARS